MTILIILYIFSGPHFELMASAKLSLEEVDDKVHTHDMKIENTRE